MIDAKELRIGNYVRHVSGSMQVIALNEIGKDGYGEINGWEEAEFWPIKLSPELLEKAGFIETDKCWWEKDGFQILLGYTDEYGDFFHYADNHTVLSTAHRYLHELQNGYFFIVGKELSIDLK